MKKENISEYIGKRYGRVVIISDMPGVNKYRRVMVLCDCGNKKDIVLNSLKRGDTNSCGCLRIEVKTKHGLSYHPLKKIWTAMKSRCDNDNDPSYPNYGGRGVYVCEEWANNLEAFHNWCVKNGWKKGMDVDKDIKADGRGMVYSPDFCSIVTRKKNLRSKGNNRIISYNGESRCVSEWCEIFNLSRRAIEGRIRNGWSVDEMLTTPVREKRKTA